MLCPHWASSNLEKKENDEFENNIKCTFAGKQKLQGCDYRLAAATVAQYLRGQSYYSIIPQDEWSVDLGKNYSHISNFLTQLIYTVISVQSKFLFIFISIL